MTDEHEITPDEAAALADEITGQTKDEGFYYDDVAAAVARAEADNEGDES